MNKINFGDVLSFLSKYKLALLFIALGVIALIFGSGQTADKEPNISASEQSEITAKVYTEYLEEKIAELISKLDGVSGVSVLLTLEGGSELIYAENRSEGSVDYLIIDGADGEEPVLLREIYSSVRGIAVVCRGGDDANTKRKITELLSSAFDLPSTKISVAGAD